MLAVRRHVIVLLIALVLFSGAACGVSLRSPISTSSGVTIPKNAKVRTGTEAEQIALNMALTTLAEVGPTVIQTRLMVHDPQRPSGSHYVTLGSNADPARLVWLVDLGQKGTDATPCPAPPPGIDQTICWYPPTTSIAISVKTGDVVSISAPDPAGKGTAGALTIAVPATATVRTRQQAMAAGFKLVPGQDGGRPTIVDVELLSGVEWASWLKQRGVSSEVKPVDPAVPVWLLEFTAAALPDACTPVNQSSCVHEHVFLSLDALDGQNLGFLFPAAGSPANFTP